MATLFKKVLSFLLVAALIVTFTAVFTVPAAAATTFDEKNIVLTFGAMTDVHLRDAVAEEHFRRALDVTKSYNPDALLFAGDYTYEGKKSEAEMFRDQLTKNFDPKKTAMVIAYGNHDTSWGGCMNTKGWYDVLKNLFQFQADDSDPENGNHHVVVNGFHFLTIQTQTYSPNQFSRATVDWVQDTLDDIVKKNPNQPIFIATHGPSANTVYGSSDELDGATAPWGYSKKLDDILEDYPQVILFSGHTHYGVSLDRAIMQTGYTSVAAGSVIGLDIMWSTEADKYVNTHDANLTATSQGHIVQVDKNGVTRITRIDYGTGKTIGQPWIIRKPDAKGSHLTDYTWDRAKTAAPVINADSCLVQPIGTSSARLTFDYPKTNTNVFSYTYTLKKDGKQIKTMNVLADWWNHPSGKPATVTWQFDGLDVKWPFQIEITPVDEWGNTGKTVTVTAEDTDAVAKKLAAKVDAAIKSIGKVGVQSAEAIQAARAAYNELNERARKQVTALATLTAAEKAYQNLWADDELFTIDAVLKTSMMGMCEETDRGVICYFDNVSHGVGVSLYDGVKLDGMHLRLEDLLIDGGGTQMMALTLSSVEAPSGYNGGDNALVCFNFTDGKVILYPNSGGTTILQSNILLKDNLKDSSLDIKIAKKSSGIYTLTVETPMGTASGDLTPTCLAANSLTNLDKVYASLTSWCNTLGMNCTIISFHGGETACNRKYLRSDVENAAKAEKLIAAIGKVTADSGKAIDDAKAVYESLSAEGKKMVKNSKVLQDAIKAYSTVSTKPTGTTTTVEPGTDEPDTAPITAETEEPTAPTEQDTEEPATEPAETEEPSTEPAENGGLPLGALIGIIAGAVVLIAAVVVIIVISRKKAK